MLDVIKNILTLTLQFINGVFNFKIELVEDGEPIEIGIIVTAFIFTLLALYLILKACGIIGGDKNADSWILGRITTTISRWLYFYLLSFRYSYSIIHISYF